MVSKMKNFRSAVLLVLGTFHFLIVLAYQFPVHFVSLTSYLCAHESIFTKPRFLNLTSALLFVRPPAPFSSVERRTATVKGVRSEVKTKIED